MEKEILLENSPYVVNLEGLKKYMEHEHSGIEMVTTYEKPKIINLKISNDDLEVIDLLCKSYPEISRTKQLAELIEYIVKQFFKELDRSETYYVMETMEKILSRKGNNANYWRVQALIKGWRSDEYWGSLLTDYEQEMEDQTYSSLKKELSDFIKKY